jgi:hypothetical protein
VFVRMNYRLVKTWMLDLGTIQSSSSQTVFPVSKISE